MDWMITALALGFLGSFHCVGMCGPIALALPVVGRSPLSRVLGVVLYNSGRSITYAVLGLLFGLLGKAFILSGYQQTLSIVLGVFILLVLVTPAQFASRIPLLKAVTPAVAALKQKRGALFHQRSYESLLAIGVLNGLLPCGLVYTAVAGAIAAGSATSGSLFMLLFGLGTIPAMMAVSFAGQYIKLEWRNKMRSVVPVFVGLMAVVLILRGMNLGIPYISPQMSKTDYTKHSCCHKN